MSQDIFPDINPSTTSGTQLATLLNQFKAALMSGLAGTSRPSELLAGGMWLDTSQEGSPNFLWRVKIYDGTTDRTVFTLNLASGNIILGGSEDEFSITHISADAVGPILKLIKRRIASNGQVLANDIVGESQFIGRGSDSSNPIVAAIRALAINNMTGSAAGAYLAFFANFSGATTLTEMMRIKDALVAVGAGFDAENTIHARGTTGIKSERITDDAVGAKMIVRKKRTTGGAVSSGDQLGAYEAHSTDNDTTPAEFTAATIEAEAVENHTTANQGTKWIVKVKKALTNTLSSIMEIGGEIKSLVLHSFEMVKLNSQDVPTTASINQLSADKAIVRMTGSTATDIRGINSAAGKTKVLVIHNDSSAVVTCKHANGTATAADRFDLPAGRDVKISAGSSAEFFYDETDTRWKVKSGAGSGGGEPVVSGSRGTPTAITAAGGITASTTDIETVQFVEADTGHISISANPQISAGYQVGQKLRLIGRNNDKTITIANGNGVSSKGDLVLYEDSIIDGMWDGTNWNLAQIK